MPAPAPERPIGAHVRVARGLATGGLAFAESVAAEAIQVFAANPRGWALPTGDPAQDRAMRERVDNTGLPVYVHAPYLINLGSPDQPTRERSALSLAHSLRRGRDIGALGVVVHTGSAVGGDREQGLLRVRELLLPLLDTLADGEPDLLLEPMAGQGQMLCGPLPDLRPFLDALDWHPRAAVCLDTCHAFAAGHDLAAPGGAPATLDLLVETIGLRPGPGGSRLRLIHANDSKDACGSRRDRHQNIGAGRIGLAPFAALLSHPATRHVPFIVETPGGRDGMASDVATLKRLRDEARQDQRARPGAQAAGTHAGAVRDRPVPGLSA